MAKIATDRTTIDLFALDKRPGPGLPQRRDRGVRACGLRSTL